MYMTICVYTYMYVYVYECICLSEYIIVHMFANSCEYVT